MKKKIFLILSIFVIFFSNFDFVNGAEIKIVDNPAKTTAFNSWRWANTANGFASQTFNTGSACNISKIQFYGTSASPNNHVLIIQEATSTSDIVNNQYNRVSCFATVLPIGGSATSTVVFSSTGRDLGYFPSCYVKQNTLYSLTIFNGAGTSNTNLYYTANNIATGTLQINDIEYSDRDLSFIMYTDDSIACPTISGENEGINYDLRTYTTLNIATTSYTTINTGDYYASSTISNNNNTMTATTTPPLNNNIDVISSYTDGTYTYYQFPFLLFKFVVVLMIFSILSFIIVYFIKKK